jgi:hypothetical protein
MKLNHTEVSLMTDAGSVIYKKTALHDSSRTLLFAEDYAHNKALERTRAYKQQLHAEGVKEQLAGTHAGSISVTSKVEKKSGKEIDEDKNDQTGTIRSTTTTKNKHETQKLTVKISNITTHPDTYTLAWAFFAKPITGGDVSIHDNGSEDITVEARQRAQHAITAKMLTATETTIDQNSSNSKNPKDPKVKKSGQKPAGYVVVLKHGDTVLDKKASSSTYLSDGWLEKINQ